MHRSDELLLELALRGDSPSFGELVRRWEGKIYGFIRRYVGNREDAKDLTQITFAKAYQHLGRLSDPARFSSWIYSIALNECRMCFRKVRRLRPVSLEESREEVELRENQGVSPERAAAGREKIARLELAFRRLPREQREAILMKEFQGLRFQEIADTLGIPLSTAKSRLYLGLKTLKKLMEDDDDL